MKKFFISLAVLAVSAAAIVAVNFNSSLDKQFDANVDALAAIENPISTCDTYCYDRSSWVCVLKTNYGFDINCIDMYLRPQYQ